MGEVVSLTHNEAWDLVAAARQLMLDDGKQANICVVNRQGQVLVQLLMDHTRPVTSHIAFLKAKQSAYTAERTSWIQEKLEAKEITLGLFNIDSEEYVPWAGGVPIYTPDGILLGGMGICNLPEDEDEDYCVKVIEEAGYVSSRV